MVFVISKTAAQIRALGTADREDGLTYQARDLGGAWFYFDLASTAVAGAEVLVPDDNPATGRWLKSGAASAPVEVGTTAPTSTPTAIGQEYVQREVTSGNVFLGIPVNFDRIRVNRYLATGTTSASDWEPQYGTIKIVSAGTSTTADTFSPTATATDADFVGQRYVVDFGATDTNLGFGTTPATLMAWEAVKRDDSGGGSPYQWKRLSEL